MRIIKSEKIEQAVYELAKKACLSLIPSCKTALKNASEIENNKSAKFALDTILQNAEIAQKENKNTRTVQTQLYRAKGMLKKMLETESKGRGD